MSFFMGHQLRSFAIPAEKRPVTRYPGISISSKVISSRGRKTHSPALAGNIQTSPLPTLSGVYYPRSGLRQQCNSARAAHLRRQGASIGLCAPWRAACSALRIGPCVTGWFAFASSTTPMASVLSPACCVDVLAFYRQLDSIDPAR
jgi:hypothetical protein